MKELEKVYNRGFSSGFYFDVPSSNAYAGVEGSKATTRKAYVGKVLNYYKEIEVAHILMESGQIKTDDEILIMGETTGVLDIKLENHQPQCLHQKHHQQVHGMNLLNKI